MVEEEGLVEEVDLEAGHLLGDPFQGFCADWLPLPGRDGVKQILGQGEGVVSVTIPQQALFSESFRMNARPY